MTNKETTQYLAKMTARGFFEVKGDRLATNFWCSGAVILAALLSATTAADQLSSITGLPIEFTGAIVFLMQAKNLWSHEDTAAPSIDLLLHRDDLDLIKDSLEVVLVVLRTAVLRTEGALEVLRAGALVGGGLEGWTNPDTHDAPKPSHTELWS